jgi:porin
MSAVAPTTRAQATAPDSGAPRAASTVFTYMGELVGDVAGGTRRGATFTGAAGVQVTILPQQLVGWRGARLFAFVLGTHGGAPSDLVGDVQGVSDLQAPPAVRLEEMWLQQNLLANRLSWLVGRYDLNSEFHRLQSGGLFVNSSFGVGAEFSQSGVAGPSIYPNTAVGTRVDFKPSRNVVGRVAVLDGVPVDRPGGGIRLFGPGDGALLVGEVAILSRPDSLGEPRNQRFRVGRGGPVARMRRSPRSGGGTTRHGSPISSTRFRPACPCSIEGVAACTSRGIERCGRRGRADRVR